MSINIAIFTGNLTREPETGATKSGVEAISFCVAVNDNRKNAAGEWESTPNYIDVTAYGKPWLADKLHKGTKVAVQGALRYYTWTDKQTSAKRSKLDVVANAVNVMSAPKPAQDQPALYDADLPF